VFPRLVAAFQDPAHANRLIDPVRWALAWLPVIPVNYVAVLLAREFFPRCLDILHAWLASGKAIFGDFRDLLFGVRTDIQVKVLSETYMGSNLQVAILCYARCDFAATRAASFTTAEGITGV
jgi:hypothetical protein